MTFSYAGPGVDDVSTIRFHVGDTDASEFFLSDEEITYLIGLWTEKESVYYTAAEAAEAIANKLTKEVDVSSDGQSIPVGQMRDRYLDLAEKLREKHIDALVGGSSLYAGGMDAYESSDPTVAPLAFGRGMHDAPEAGQQDYGDVSTKLYSGWDEP